jgi:hypothetical protein
VQHLQLKRGQVSSLIPRVSWKSKMAAAWQLLLIQVTAMGLAQAGNCDVSNIDKWDCGQMGTNQVGGYEISYFRETLRNI